MERAERVASDNLSRANAYDSFEQTGAIWTIDVARLDFSTLHIPSGQRNADGFHL